MLMLAKDGLLRGPLLPISSVLERHRSQYTDYLVCLSTEGDWLAWTRFFLTSVMESADEALQLVEALDDLRSEWHRQLQSARSSALLIKLADSLFRRPATTITEAARLLEVTPASASANITRLQQAGILREVSGRKRDPVYTAPAILKLVSEGTPHAGTSDPSH